MTGGTIMLRIGKRTYRFSKKVEDELSKIGIHITKAKGYKGSHLYCDDRLKVFVYSVKEYPDINIESYLHEYHNLEDFLNAIENRKNLAIKIYEIVMQDYPGVTEEVGDHG